MKGVVHSLYWSDLQYSTKGADDLVGEHGGTKTTSIHALLGYDPMINTEAYERHLESKEN